LLVYLWPSEGHANIYTLDQISGDTRQLTQHTTGVDSYSLTHNGLSIYYSVSDTQGNSQILHLERLYGETTQILNCFEALCDNPHVSPNGDYMAYERTPLGPSGESERIQVWLLPLDGGEPRPASSQTSHSPDWSPSGLLTYYDEDQGAFKLLDPTSGESVSIPNETGEPGTWSPNGDLFVVPEIIFLTDNDPESPPFTSHLLGYNHPTLNREDLSPEDILEDGNPVFSPDGSQIAFARRYLDEERWTPGRQLWLMKPDGVGATQLTEDAKFQHSNFAWSPDGEQLAYVRYNLTTLTDPPEIWTIDYDGREALRLVVDGYDPQWLP
jgi:Tol biopolymer transport system component